MVGKNSIAFPYGVGVAGVGKYLPDAKITNEDLEASAGVKAEDILQKTGIVTRCKAADDEVMSDMAVKAAKEAINSASIDPLEIGLIITCTFTGDYVYPAVSCRIQERLGAVNAGVFDLMANCTGFQVGLGVASDRMLIDPKIKYAIVIGAALQTRFIDPSDADSSIYFGDGVGAAVLEQVPAGYGIISNDVLANGKAFDAVRLRGGGSSFPMRADNVGEGLQYYDIVGLEVWKQVVTFQPKNIRLALKEANLKLKDIDFFIFHQANGNLIKFLMSRLELPMSKTHLTVNRFGNTADASIGITLDEALRKKKIKKNDIILLSGVGAGFIFGTSILKWAY